MTSPRQIISVSSILTLLINYTLAAKDHCSIDAAFTWNRDKKLYFLKGEYYMRWEDGHVGKLKDWRFPSSVDAALSISSNNNMNYVFKGCLVWTVYHTSMITLGPFHMRQLFRGIPCSLDAATTVAGKILFFKGSRYWVWDETISVALEGKIGVWPKIGNNIDAAFQWDGKAYFLKGRTYWRFDTNVNTTAIGDTSIGWSQLINGPLLPDCACDCTNCCNSDWDFYKIEYLGDKASSMPLQEEIIDQQTVDNRGAGVAPTVGFVVSRNVTETEYFLNSKSETLEVGRSFKCPLPHIHKNRVYKSQGIPSQHYWAKELAETKHQSVKYVSPTTARKKTTFTTTLHMMQLDIPFIMTMKYKQRQCSCNVDGSLRLNRLDEIKMSVNEE